MLGGVEGTAAAGEQYAEDGGSGPDLLLHGDSFVGRRGWRLVRGVQRAGSSCRSGIGYRNQEGSARRASSPAGGRRLGDRPAGDAGQGFQVDGAGLDPEQHQHVHEVFGGDVAGRAGGERAPAEAADRRVEVGDPRRHPGQYVGEAEASGVVEVERESHVGEVGAQSRAEPVHVRGIGQSGGVGHRHPAYPHRVVLAHHPGHPVVGQASLERAAERGGEPADDLHAHVRGQCDHVRHAGQRLGRVAVGVGPAVGVADREHGLPDVHLVFGGPLGALEVRHEYGVLHAVAGRHPAHHLGAVTQLGYGLRADERRHLHPVDAGPRERVDDLDLALGRDHRRLELEPVARSDLVDPDPRGQLERQIGATSGVLLEAHGPCHVRSLPCLRGRRGRRRPGRSPRTLRRCAPPGVVPGCGRRPGCC